MISKFEIENTKKLKIRGLIYGNDEISKLENIPTATPQTKQPSESPVIIMVHGFRGRMSQRFISMSAQSISSSSSPCVKVICFDATNMIGESEGNLYDFTVSSFIDDLSCVIKYVRENISSNVILLGHSLGGLACLCAAKKFKINSLIFISPALFALPHGYLDYRLYLSHIEGQIVNFKYEDEKQDELLFSLSWESQLDYLTFTQDKINKLLSNLNIPKHFIYFEKDEAIPLKRVEENLSVASSYKTLDIIKNAPHNPKDPIQIQDLVDVIKRIVTEKIS